MKQLLLPALALLLASACLPTYVPKPYVYPTPPVIASSAPSYQPITTRWHVCGVDFCNADGAYVPWRGLSDFLLYRIYLEQGEPAVRTHLAFVRATFPRVTVLRVWLMSRYLDGGETDDVQLWPQRYGDRFYASLAPFVQLVGSYGLRVELTVFADADVIMPSQGDQQRHLDRVVDAVREQPALAGIEVCNEADRHNANGVDVRVVRPSNPAGIEWATGDYDIENRTDFPHGTYGTYHGARSAQWSGEAAKEAHFYESGWDETRDDGSPSFFAGARIPWVNDEPKGLSGSPTNRWGDARETDPRRAEEAGAGMCVGSAGATAHGESMLMSRTPDAAETALLNAFLDGLSWCQPGTNAGHYVHDGAGAWLVPVNDASIVWEVAGRENGGIQQLVAAGAVDGWQPRPIDAQMVRSGQWGERITLTR